MTVTSRNQPTGGDYSDALQCPMSAFGDVELRMGTVELNRMGLPRPLSGNFASVYRVRGKSGRTWAVKCFTRFADEQSKRYKAISHALAPLQGGWKVGFEYQDDGVVVRGKKYPLLIMEWVDAVGVNEWIEMHLGDTRALMRLAERFRELVSDLETAGIAHGDLQHGNMLITPDGSIKLIDYDGMYVPALLGKASTERGHRNYQSPQRGNEFNAHMDQFSAHLIYASLVALAEDHSLWFSLHENGSESLLFKEADYKDPNHSMALDTFRASSNATIARLAVYCGALLRRKLPDIGPLSHGEILVSRAELPPSLSPCQLIAAHGSSHGKPDWIPERVSTAVIGEDSMFAAGEMTPTAWLDSQLGPLPTVGFRGSCKRERLQLACIWSCSLLVIFAVGLESFNARLCVISVVCAIAASLTILHAAYRNDQSVAGRRTARRRVSEWRRSAKAAKVKLRGLENNLQQVLSQSHVSRVEKLVRQRGEEQRNARQAVNAIETALNEKLAEVGREYQDALRAARDERTRLLRLIQDAHSMSCLSGSTIAKARIHAITSELADTLRLAGFSTAADFTGAVAIGGRYGQHTRVGLVTATGRTVHVKGIGRVRASALIQWRKDIEDTARRTQPTNLPLTDNSRCVELEKRAKTKLDQYEHRFHSKAKEDKAAAQAYLQRRTSDIDRELGDIEQAKKDAAANFRQGISAAKRDLRQYEMRASFAERELLRFANLSFGRYLRYVFLGAA